MFWGIVVAVILIVFIVKTIVDRPATPEQIAAYEAAKKAAREEVTKRFKEAAEKGADPKTIIGFDEIEKVDELKNSKMYVQIKDICMGLAKKGYEVGSPSIYHREYDNTYHKERHECRFYVYHGDEEIGEIEFWDVVSNNSSGNLDHYYTMEHIENRYKTGKLCHIILTNFFKIKSKVAPPEPPPEWLVICANVLKQYSPPVKDPEWLREYPDAKKYVNAMF